MKINAVVSIIIVCASNALYAFQDLADIDSLKQLIKEENTPISTYGELAGTYYHYDMDSGYKYVKIMESLAVARRDTLNMLVAKNRLAEYYWRTGEYDQAMNTVLPAFKIAEDWGNAPYELARLNLTMGTVNLYVYNLDEALLYYKKALAFFEELKLPVQIAKVTNNMGVTYMSMGMDKGIEWGYDSAIVYFNKVLTYFGTAQPSTVSNSLTNLLQIYSKLKNLEDGLALLKKWEDFFLGPMSMASKAMGFGSIASIYELNEDFEKALFFANKGLSYSLELGMPFEIQEYYGKLSDLYEQTNDPVLALEYARIKENIKDSLYNLEKEKAVNDLNLKYETEKKEKDIAKLEQEKLLSALAYEKENQWKIVLTALTGLLILVLGFVYYRYVIKMRTAQLLDNKNRELSNLNNTKNRLFALISHDLKNPVSAFHSITHSLSENLDSLSTDDLREYLKSLDESSLKLNELLYNLLNWAINESGGLGYHPESVDLKEATSKVINLYSLSAGLKDLTVHNQIPEGLIALTDRKMCNAVLRNLIGNAIKFSHKGGAVFLETVCENGSIRYSVTDQGIGISRADQDKLFKLGEEVRKIGVSEEKGPGLGLFLIKDLVEKQGGEIWLESQLGKGSKFTFSMKVGKDNGFKPVNISETTDMPVFS